MDAEGALPKDAVSSSYVASLLRQEGFRVRKGTDNKTFVYGLALDAPTYAESGSREDVEPSKGGRALNELLDPDEEGEDEWL